MTVLAFSLTLVLVTINRIDYNNLHVSVAPELRSKVIIDPGHGGVDSGATGIGGVEESTINLGVSQKLRDMLTAFGYEVIMTREKDESIHDESAKTIRNKKKTDLHNRLRIANDNPDAVYISIHQNTFSQSQYHGMQVFYSTNNPGSSALAQMIQSNTTQIIQPDNKRKIKPAGKNIFIIYNAKQEAVLVECGFLSNPDDARNLQTQEYQQELAFAICCGIVEYLST